MSANPTQVVDPQEFASLDDYEFLGDNRTIESKRSFIDCYRRKATIYHAARAARVARSTVYKWIEEDSEFAQAVADSFEDAADVMETSTYEEALGTDEKPGNPLLKMFWLKAHRPKFRDKMQVDLSAVQSDIDELMSKVNQRQLPPIMTQFVDTDFNQTSQEYQAIDSNHSDNKPFQSPSQLQQKED